MILKKVSLKKKFRYEYEDLKELIQHHGLMIAAKFHVDFYDETNLVAIYSQIIDEVNYNVAQQVAIIDTK